MKIALIEAGHWHTPLYLDGLSGDDLEIVAVSDALGGSGRVIAERSGARFYDRWVDLLEAETMDFAFAFGRPVEMPVIGDALVQAGVPFALEKPCGIDLDGVSTLAETAAAANHFVAVPYLYRIGPLREALAQLAGGLPARLHHMSFRFIGGPPRRYLETNCPWMLDRAQSGGGALMNLGGHFIDLVSLLTGEAAKDVVAFTSDSAYSAGVEDYATLMLRCEGGAVAVIEAGYTFPSAGEALREFLFTLRSDSHYVTSTGDGLIVRDVTQPSEAGKYVGVELRNERYYPMFVTDTLARLRQGEPPACGLAEAVEVMDVIVRAYRSEPT